MLRESIRFILKRTRPIGDLKVKVSKEKRLPCLPSVKNLSGHEVSKNLIVTIDSNTRLSTIEILSQLIKDSNNSKELFIIDIIINF